MTAIRPVRPTDLVALVTFDGRVYPNEAKSCERIGRRESAPHPLESALEQWFSFARGRHTWISVKGATLRGLVSARRRSSRAVWEVDCLINAVEDDGAVCRGLLEQAVADAERNGVERLFLRLCADSPVVPIARKAGFSEYLAEQQYCSRAPRAEVAGSGRALGLRRRTRGDDFGLLQLHNAAVPEAVRRFEGLTLGEWKAVQERRWLSAPIAQQVVERDGRIVAWARHAANGDTARFDVTVHPEEPRLLEPVVDALQARLARRATLLVVVPEYAEGLRRSLARRGFEKGQEYRLLMKRTTVAVRAPQLAPAIGPGI